MVLQLELQVSRFESSVVSCSGDDWTLKGLYELAQARGSALYLSKAGGRLFVADEEVCSKGSFICFSSLLADLLPLTFLKSLLPVEDWEPVSIK